MWNVPVELTFYFGLLLIQKMRAVRVGQHRYNFGKFAKNAIWVLDRAYKLCQRSKSTFF